MILSDFFRNGSFVLIVSTIFANTQLYSQDKMQEDNEPLQALNLLFEEKIDQPILITSPVEEEKIVDLSDIFFPDEIYTQLKEYTIGQDEAMQSLATFIHEHLVTMRLREAALKNPENPLFQGLSLEKPNILMVGPTGCGKTSSLNILSQFLKIPLAVGNATEWTAQGYIGSKWQEVFEKLYQNSKIFLQKEGKDTNKDAVRQATEHGIIFIDEIDKLCTKNTGDLGVIDRVQQELLPAIQGMNLKLNNGEIINTTNILFIAGGAFPGLISSNAVNNGKLKNEQIITPQKLENYGMLPELAGRLCNIVQFSALSQDDLKQIILKSKNSPLSQYIQKYKLAYGINLAFTHDAIDYIAEIASHQKTGARAINAMLFKLMKDKTFNIKSYVGKRLSIDKDTATRVLKNYSDELVEKPNPSYMMMYL